MNTVFKGGEDSSEVKKANQKGTKGENKNLPECSCISAQGQATFIFFNHMMQLLIVPQITLLIAAHRQMNILMHTFPANYHLDQSLIRFQHSFN